MAVLSSHYDHVKLCSLKRAMNDDKEEDISK